MKPLGRRIPEDFSHVDKYPLSALIADPLSALVVPPDGTEKNLGLPWWWKQHDQGQEGSCVGFGCSAMMSITNHKQRLINTGKAVTYRYGSKWLYDQAQLADEWPETPPEEGTSVNAGCKVLKAKGHRRLQSGALGPALLSQGISAYRWATKISEIRAALYANLAVAIGVVWYDNFDNPVIYNKERWIGRGNLGTVRGGHCASLFAMSDKRNAFKLMNSWGEYYPPVWISYSVMQHLIDEWGEVVVITDR